jgi:hypothetical protein
MRLRPPPISLPALSLLGALAGCAHGRAATASPAVAQAAVTPGAPAAVLVTGSRIPRAVDPLTGRAVTESAVSVYSARELIATGDPDLAGALRRLDPSVH